MPIVQKRPPCSILKQYEPVLAIAKFGSGHENRFRPHVGGRVGQFVGNQRDWICPTKVGIVEPPRVVFFAVDIEWQQAPGVADLVGMFAKQVSNLRLNAIDVDMQLVLASVMLRIQGKAHLVSRDFPLQVTEHENLAFHAADQYFFAGALGYPGSQCLKFALSE